MEAMIKKIHNVHHVKNVSTVRLDLMDVLIEKILYVKIVKNVQMVNSALETDASIIKIPIVDLAVSVNPARQKSEDAMAKSTPFAYLAPSAIQAST
jgi:hypothetical protein